MDERSDSDSAASEISRHATNLLEQHQQLTNELIESPYDCVLCLRRAVVYRDLAYPDLAAGDAYRALSLTDEVLNEGFEYHEQALSSLEKYSLQDPPDVLKHGALSTVDSGLINGFAEHGDSQSGKRIAAIASVRSYQIISLSLLLCRCLKSSLNFCDRGLLLAPRNQELLEIKEYIKTAVDRRFSGREFTIHELSDWGMVRREVYPWNDFEPDRFSEESLNFLNKELGSMAPKCAVKVSRLPVLLDGASETDGYDIIPECDQLGVFAKEDIAPGETVLEEYSLLTANNRLKESVCDACSAELPPLQEGSAAVSCPECVDTVFCDEFCYNKAMELYHPAVCDKDVDSIAKDTDAKDADDALHLLLLARVLAMSAHQDVNPLDVSQIKYIWGDFVSTKSNSVSLSLNAGPPPDWTLPFSFEHNIEAPFHILEKMDIDIYATIAKYDVWIFNTIYAKTRGTASARKSPRDGRPDVAAVHPFWCLANHDCDPNVTWEWGGRMVLTARETRVVSGKPEVIKSGEEILNHYCDVTIPVQQRREWAAGSLGGWCMCRRCRKEAAADAAEQ